MKRLFVYLLLFVTLFTVMPINGMAQETNEELTDEEKQRLQEIEDHGFLEAIYEIFYFHRLVLSHDYKNYQEESGKLEELQLKFKEQTGVNFYSRGHLVAPDFWPRVFRRDEPYAEQFPAIEFLFPLKEIDGGYELDIQSELFLNGQTALGCLTKERLDDIEKYINTEFLKGKKNFADDDETQKYLNEAYEALFEKLRFFIKSDISEKKVCVGEAIDLGQDLKNFSLSSSSKNTYNWNDGKGNQFDGLVWKTALTAPVTYTLTIKDPAGNTCQRSVKVSPKTNCTSVEDPSEGQPGPVECKNPNGKILRVDPGVDETVCLDKQISLANRSKSFGYTDKSSGNFKYEWISTKNAITNPDGSDPVLVASNTDVLVLKVEDRNFPKNDGSGEDYFTCYAGFNLTVNRSFEPVFRIKLDNQVLHEDAMVLEVGNAISLCNNAHKLELEIKENSSSGCPSITDASKYKWTFKPYKLTAEIKSGKIVSFDLGNKGARVEAELSYNNQIIASQVINRVGAAAYRAPESVYGFDDYNRAGKAKHISVKVGGLERLKIQLDIAEAASDFSITAGNGISLNTTSFTSAQQTIEINAALDQDVSQDNGIPLVVSPIKSIGNCSNILTVQVHPYKELNGCVNFLSVNSNVSLGEIDHYLNKQVFNQAVIHWNISIKNIQSSESSSELDISAYPNSTNSDEVSTLIQKGKQNQECGKYFVFLINKNIKGSSSGGLPYAILRQSEYAGLPGDVLFVNVSSFGSSEKLHKVVAYYLAKLVGLPDIAQGDEKNLMYVQGDQYFLRLDQWKELRTKIKTVDFSKPAPVETASGLWSGDEPRQKVCPNYQNSNVSISYRKEIELPLGNSVSLAQVFNYSISPSISIRPAESFTSVIAVVAVPVHLMEDINTDPSFKYTSIGQPQFDDLVAKYEGIYKYTLAIGSNYTCEAFTKVKVFDEAGEFEKLLKAKDHEGMAELVVGRFTEESHSKIEKFRLEGIKLLTSALGYVGDDDEEKAINDLLAYTPPDQAGALVKQLCVNNLLQNIRDGVDGDNYAGFIQALRKLIFNATDKAKFSTLSKSLKEKDYTVYVPSRGDPIMVFPWDHALLGGIQGPIYDELIVKDVCNFSIDYCYGYIKPFTTQPSLSDLCANSDFRKQAFINCNANCTPQPIQLDPLELIGIQFIRGSEELNIKPGTILIVPAITLKFLLDKKFNHQLLLTAELMGLMISGGELAVAKGGLRLVIASIDFGLSAAAVGVRTFRDEIWVLEGGREWLHVWDQVEAMVGVVYAGKLVVDIGKIAYASPQLIKDLRASWNKVKEENPVAFADLPEEEVKKVDEFLAQAEKELDIAPAPVVLKFEWDQIIETVTEDAYTITTTYQVTVKGEKVKLSIGSSRFFKDTRIAQFDVVIDKKLQGQGLFREIVTRAVNKHDPLKLKAHWKKLDIYEEGQSTNLTVFQQKQSEGLSTTEAAFETPTGKVYKSLGYDKIEIRTSSITGDEVILYFLKEKILKLGDRLGDAEDGVHKDVFVLADDPSKAIAILRSTAPQAQIQKEFDILKALEAKQFPVVEAFEVTTHEGKPALIMRRYKCEGSKNIMDFQTSNYISQKTVESLENIRKLLQQHNVEIEDLQFLILEDGTAIIHDPLNMFNRAPTNISMSRIDYFLEFAYTRLLPKEIVGHVAFKALSSVKKSELCRELNNFPDLLTAIKNKPELISTWNSIAHLKAHRTNPNYLEAFKFVNESEGMKHHIFQGDHSTRLSNQTGVFRDGASGVHHKSALDGGFARIRPGTTPTAPNNFGIYEVTVDVALKDGSFVPKLANDGKSSFFPDAWDQQHVLEEIGFAFMNKVHVQNTNYRGTSTLGFTIQFFYEDNIIISAYPRL